MHIGFVNFNTEEKKRIAEMMQLLKEQEAVEELGIGRVRDYFSNNLFPGTSTLQHHAKYFVVLPWIYYNAITGQSKFKDRKEVDEYIRKEEIKLTICLSNANQGATGITGKDKIAEAEKDYRKYVKYNPTYIYSSGLHKYGIVSSTNIEQLILSCNGEHHQELTEDNEEKKGHSRHIVTCGEKYDLENENGLSLKLTDKEAGFLRGKILSVCRESMLGKIIESGKEMPESYFEAAALIQSHPEILDLYTKSVLFSKLIHILDWRYNYVYYNSFHHEDKAEKCLAEFNRLKKAFSDDIAKDPQLEDQYLELFSSIRTIDPKLTEFCENCYSVLDSPEDLDTLIIEREKKVKQKRAKIGSTTYKDKDRSAPLPNTFRWDTVRTIVNEINNHEK